MAFKIKVFSWNAGGLRLCETMSQKKADEARKGFFAAITLKKKCVAPDFFETIRASIIEDDPELIVMTTQDEDSKDTYFHSDLVPDIMTEIGYSLVKRHQVYKVGEAASGVVLKKVISGVPSGSALRMSIYARNDVFPDIESGEMELQGFMGHEGQQEAKCIQSERYSGAIVGYIWHRRYGKFAFIAVDIPAGVSALNVTDQLEYESFRAVAKAANTICLTGIFNKFITRLPDEAQPDHVFLIGDLNYDIVVANKSSLDVISELAANQNAGKLKEIQKNDELRQAMNEVPALYGFKEGVSNEGPLFMPTWNMAMGRPESCATKVTSDCYSSDIRIHGGIGWHDRILYKELQKSPFVAHCLSYNRIDIQNMHESTHAGVIADFDIRVTK